MPDDHDSISMKEMLLRIEANLKTEINGLRREVELFQDRAVSRTEYDATMSHMRKELDRIERQNEQNAQQLRDELTTFKQDLKDGQAKLIAIAGLVFTIANFVLTWMIF